MDLVKQRVCVKPLDLCGCHRRVLCRPIQYPSWEKTLVRIKDRCVFPQGYDVPIIQVALLPKFLVRIENGHNYNLVTLLESAGLHLGVVFIPTSDRQAAVRRVWVEMVRDPDEAVCVTIIEYALVGVNEGRIL